VEAAAAGRFALREVFVTEEAAERERPLMRSLAKVGVPILGVTDRALRSVAETVTPQGIVAVVGLPSPAGLPVAPRLVVVLDRCADPGNVGTVIRTADAVGADAVVLGSGCADPWSGKCVRASAGSVFNLPIVTALSAADALDALRKGGCRLLATATDGEAALDTLVADGRLAASAAWVFGSEAHGLDPALRALADETVRVPLRGRAESLNLAACAAICLYCSATAQGAPRPAIAHLRTSDPTGTA
jgi:TrmH family RNA methyltransferase